MGIATLRWREQLTEVRHRYGRPAALKWLAARAAKKTVALEISEMVWLSGQHLPTSINVDPEFTLRFLSTEEVADLVSDPECQLMPEFVCRAAGEYDLCFAALDANKKVVHYGWYALGSIEGAHHLGVAMSFPEDVAYMYNAFTSPEVRGRGLHAAAMALALEHLAPRGINHLLSTIEWTNYASLRSFQRLGFKRLGRLWTFGRGNCRWNLTPKAARSLGIRFGAQAHVRQRSGIAGELVAV